MRTVVPVDPIEGLAEVVGQGVGGGDGVGAGLDLDAVAAGGADELPDCPAGGVLDPAADRERCEDRPLAYSDNTI